MRRRTKKVLVLVLTLAFALCLGSAATTACAEPSDIIDECNSTLQTPASEICGLTVQTSDLGFGTDSRFTVTLSPQSAAMEYNWWNYSYVQYSISSHNLVNVYADCAPEGIDVIKDVMCLSNDGSSWQILRQNNRSVQYSSNWIRVKTTFVIPQGSENLRLVLPVFNSGDGEVQTWMQQLTRVEILTVDNLPAPDSFFYVDHCENAFIHGQRADIYNVVGKSDAAATVGDTSRLIYGYSGNESYIDYYIVRQNTVKVYIYEEILPGNARPSGMLEVKFSLFGAVWEADATSTEVELGRYDAPKRYTRIIKSFSLPSVIDSGKVRVHIYNNGDQYQVGRVEIFDSNNVVEPEESPSSGKNFQISAYLTQAEIGIGWVKDSVDFENGIKNMAACGINVNIPYIWGGDTPEYRHRLLDAAYKYGIKTYVYDAAFNSYLKSGSGYNPSTAEAMIASYKNHPAFLGHFIADEPSLSEINSLQNAAARYKSLLPGKDFYVNLLPNYNMSSGYSNYIDNYFGKLGLGYLSFDYYALQGLPGNYSMKTSFLHNLNYLAQRTGAENADFYTVLCSAGHYNSSDGVYLRKPQAESDLSFQAYTALAYGSKRITWFTYGAMGDDPTYGEQYGMLDSKGTKTEIYDLAKSVNEEIQYFADIYLNYRWIGTMLKEGSQGGTNPSFTNVGSAALSSYYAISSFTSTQDAILGVFSNGSNNAFLLSNFNDPALGISTSATITFDQRYTLRIYKGGQMQQVQLPPNKQYTFSLDSGEGVFFEAYPPIKSDECNSLVSSYDGDAYGVMVLESDVGFGLDKRFMSTKSVTSPPDSSNWWDGYSYIQYKTHSVYTKVDIYVDYAIEGYGLIDDIMCVAFEGSQASVISYSSKSVTYSANWPRVKYTFILPQNTSDVRFVFTAYNSSDGTRAVWMQQITKVDLYY